MYIYIYIYGIETHTNSLHLNKENTCKQNNLKTSNYIITRKPRNNKKESETMEGDTNIPEC